jgi:adenylate cyclase
VRELLDAYYEYVVAIVRRGRGTVMQFVGDEVFAVFGAPVPNEAAAADSLRCALALQDEIATLDDRLAAAGLPIPRFGVGVHRGPVVAAHVGTAQRRQYAVVGEAVNIGGRLCEAAGPGEIVVSEPALEAAGPDFQRRFVATGAIGLKGVKAPVNVYRARGASPALGGGDSATTDAAADGDPHGELRDVPATTEPATSGRGPGVVGGQWRGSDR